MSVEIWAAIIGASAAVVGVLVGQYWSANMTIAQLKHAERQEELKWRREEGRRLSELREQRLRDLWALVLEVRVRGNNLMLASLTNVQPLPDAKDSVFEAAARASAVAMIGLPDLREAVSRYYVASNQLELEYLRTPPTRDEQRMHQANREWSAAYWELEKAVSAAADRSHEL